MGEQLDESIDRYFRITRRQELSQVVKHRRYAHWHGIARFSTWQQLHPTSHSFLGRSQSRCLRCTLTPEPARFLIDCVLQSAITYNNIHYLQDNLDLW